MDSEVRRLHAQGLGDPAIAARLGVGVTAVFRRRKRLKLTAVNPRPGRSWDVDEARRLHSRGLNDREIAAELGVSRESVQKWRVGQDLPPNGWHRNPQPGSE